MTRIAQLCRLHAERHYSWHRIVEATEAVYLDLIGGSRRPVGLPRSARAKPRLTVVKKTG